jgi:hypothetical protein
MMLIGIGTTIGSLDYGLGTLARMRPGYFPLLLGILLMMISALIIATPSIPEEEQDVSSPGAHYRPWVFVAIGVVAFMVLGKFGGLVPATFALIFLSALGDRSNSMKAALALAVGMTVMAVGVFHYAMQMQFPLFTWG